MYEGHVFIYCVVGVGEIRKARLQGSARLQDSFGGVPKARLQDSARLQASFGGGGGTEGSLFYISPLFLVLPARGAPPVDPPNAFWVQRSSCQGAGSSTHLRPHAPVHNLVGRLLLSKKQQ